MRFLVADEDGGIRETVEAGLKKMDHEAETVSNGFHASTLIQSFVFNIVILDTKLLGVSWYELAYDAKDLKNPPSVIVMEREGEIPIHWRQFVDGFLPKPFGVPELAAAIAAVTKNAVA
ncbi:response regulator [Candidatus Wolfebacteria bacterium]|nr:response regulator [Candidatus Wolfebacteria bacterium]